MRYQQIKHHNFMKHIAGTIITLLIFFSCQKEKSQPIAHYPKEYELSNFPEGLSIFDFSNYGIYKGVVINSQDSSATFKLNLYNASNQPYALFYLNRKVQDSLIRYTNSNSGFMAFPQKVDTARIPFNAAFYSTYFSSYLIGFGPIVGFNTTAKGISYIMETQLYNNQTLNAVLKEKSNNQVYCFEGSYSGLDSGRVAFVVSSDSIVGIRASIWNPQFFKIMTATVSNNNFTINQVDDTSGNTFIFNGKIENNKCFGTWTKGSNSSIINNFTTIRTL